VINEEDTAGQNFYPQKRGGEGMQERAGRRGRERKRGAWSLKVLLVKFLRVASKASCK